MQRILSAYNRRYCVASIIVVCLGLFALGVTLNAQVPLTYKNVAISGANCWVEGVIPQPAQSGLFYLRTDVGGAYSLTGSGGGTAVAITDSFDFDQRQSYSIESIAVDSSNANNVYIAAGTLASPPASGYSDGEVWMSTNQGVSWTQLGSGTSASIPMGGNMDRRWGGERLAVQPGGAVVLFGSRTSGLWRYTTAGGQWTAVTSLPFEKNSASYTPDIYGVLALAFDPTSTNTVYAAVSGYGIYESTDAGATFNVIDCVRNSVRRMTVGPDGTLWVTWGGGVAKYSGGTWTAVTPSGASGVYCGLAVDPANASHVLASSGENSQSELFVTSNGGSTWSQVAFGTPTNPNVSWYHSTAVWISSMAFDTAAGHTGNVWVTGAQGIWYVTSLTSSSATFTLTEAGHEETVGFCLATPPSPSGSSGPEVLTGEADVDGFAFNANALGTYPSTKLDVNTVTLGFTTNIAYEQSNPLNMVLLGATSVHVNDTIAISTNGGSTWAAVSAMPTDPVVTAAATATGNTLTVMPERVAMSSGDPNNIVVECSKFATAVSGSYVPLTLENSPFYYTTNGGSTWTTCSGLPTGTGGFGSNATNEETDTKLALAADPVTSGVFYYVQSGGGSDGGPAIYSSTNDGQNWSSIYNAGGTLPAFFYTTLELRARPGGTAGDLWLSAENSSFINQTNARQSWEGLFHSTDGGATWARAGNSATSIYVTRAVAFGFGLGLYHASESIFLYGRLTGDTTDKIYWSQDSGTTWTDIQNASNLVANGPWDLQGSQQTFGRLFAATRGRGIVYADAQLFADNFDSGTVGSSDPSFTTIAGTFVIQTAGSGNVYAETTAGNSSATVNVTGSSTWSNYYVAAEVNPGAATSSTGISIRGRSSSAGFYFLQLSGGNQWTLSLNHSGTTTVLASGTYNYTANSNYYLKLDMQGTTISGAISSDGATWTAAGSVTDSTLSAGTVGISTWGATGTFDNVEVVLGP